MAETRTPLQRIGAITLLAIACGYAVTAGYWMTEHAFELTAINFFWCAIFGSAALVVDGPQGIRSRIWALGWIRLLGLFFVFIALCDLVVAGYWFAQRALLYAIINLVGTMFFGMLGMLSFMFAREREAAKKSD